MSDTNLPPINWTQRTDFHLAPGLSIGVQGLTSEGHPFAVQCGRCRPAVFFTTSEMFPSCPKCKATNGKQRRDDQPIKRVSMDFFRASGYADLDPDYQDPDYWEDN